MRDVTLKRTDDLTIAELKELALNMVNEIKSKSSYLVPRKHDGTLVDRHIDYCIGLIERSGFDPFLESDTVKMNFFKVRLCETVADLTGERIRNCKKIWEQKIEDERHNA